MNNPKMMQAVLIAWGVQALGERLGNLTAAQQLCPMPENVVDWPAYKGMLYGPKQEQQPSRLLAPLSVVYDPDPKSNHQPPIGQPFAPVVLQLDGTEAAVTWSAFATEFAQLPEAHRFEAFTHLFAKYAWAVPGNAQETVSLYEEFKALAALVFASGGAGQPADTFLLIGGDTSGIQDFIFTVSNKAAAKGLRGRSFFLQLVGDAIIRRLLDELALPIANLIYAAGGNFLLLGPVGVENKLETIRREVNEALLAGTQGQLRMALGWSEMSATAVANSAEWRQALNRVKEKQQGDKQRPLAQVAHDNWQSVFSPMNDGGDRYCAVCHRGLKAGEGVKRDDDQFCPLCASFSELANDIRHDELWLALKRETAVPHQEWARLLHQISGYAYRFTDKPTRTASRLYRLNNTDFLSGQAHGFRLLANVTPTMTEKDVAYATSSDIHYDHPPKAGDIRDFDVLARDGEGVDWLGVLRMDGDNLGKLFSQWLPARNMLTTSALSSSLEQFFSGHLNRIVREVATLDKGSEDERLAAYIIYAGGDDLFVVGAWHLLPQLAQAIHEQFRAYTHNDHLTISAGIGLMPRSKYPLYLAAKDAHKALDDQAKGERWELFIPDEQSRVIRKTAVKDAISFLGTAVGWQNWPQVVELQTKLVALQENKQAARSLIQLLQNVHALFDDGRKQYEEDHPEAIAGTQKVYPAYYGRWQWLLAYQFSRIKDRNKPLKEELDNIRAMIEKPTLTPYTGLAARWAEFETRKNKEDYSDGKK